MSCAQLNLRCGASSGEEAQRHDCGEEVSCGACPKGAALAEADVSGGCGPMEKPGPGALQALL